MKSAVALLLTVTSVLLAQTTGELHGVVTDSSHKVLAHAHVTARFDGTGGVRTTESDAKGEFTFAAVPVGECTVEVTADGYKDFVQRYIQVTLGHVVAVPVALQAGDATQVMATETPLIETFNTQIGTVVGGNMVLNLPLNQRNTFQLLQLQPGVQSQQGYDLFAGSENAGVVSVNGGRGRSNNFSVNGGDANDLFLGIPAIQPSPDAIEEFRVLTSGFDAEYGRNSGSVVNVVTRGGSNQIHGDLFEFLRNKALNTRGFFDSEKSKFNQNQFGGTIGGPIRRDRLFFFVSTEDRQIRQGISSDLVRVPTAAERAAISRTAPYSPEP